MFVTAKCFGPPAAEILSGTRSIGGIDRAIAGQAPILASTLKASDGQRLMRRLSSHVRNIRR